MHLLFVFFFVFFFFKQKTAYEMRISDWSSDVCSSDLSPGYAPAVSSWSAGLKVVRCIGYDDGAKDARRIGKSEDQRYIYVYPLREYHMDRLACMETILEAGLPLPIKSACFMCPASKPQELIWLHAHHPDLFMTALEIEEISRPRFTPVDRKSTRLNS